MHKLKNFPTTDTGLLVMRVMLAVVFIFHGSQKLFGLFGGPGIEGFAGFLTTLNVPMPMLNAYLSASVEFFGGLALLTGVLTRVAAVPLAFNMFVASFTAHGGAFVAANGGMEYPLTLGMMVIGLALTGPGRFNACKLVRVARNASDSAHTQQSEIV